MSTNSIIGIEENNVITSIYCHWDGYPSHNGKILKEEYDSPEKIKELIALGDISLLDANPKTCKAYHRDRGESWKNVKPTATTVQEFYNIALEYNYIFKNGQWFMCRHQEKLEPLTQEIIDND